MKQAIRTFEPIAEEEKPRTTLETEADRLLVMRHEKTRLEKEIDILMLRYQERQRLLEEQGRAASERTRVDQDRIVQQLTDNKRFEERLLKTQSEVNQLRAKIEADAVKQKNILLEKEVQLDASLADVQALKAQLAQRLQEGI